MSQSDEVQNTHAWCNRCHATLIPGHGGFCDGDEFVCSHCIDAEHVLLEIEPQDTARGPSCVVQPGIYSHNGVANVLRTAKRAQDWQSVEIIATALTRESERIDALYRTG